MMHYKSALDRQHKAKDFVMRHQLTKLLKEHEISASQLATRCGIAKQVISDWLAGAKPKHIDKVKLIADYFNVSIDELCFGCTRYANNKDPTTISTAGDLITNGTYEVTIKKMS